MFTCGDCGAGFAYPVLVDRHRHEEHDEHIDTMCISCDKYFEVTYIDTMCISCDKYFEVTIRIKILVPDWLIT